jgi:hypothetical protein
MTLDKHQIDGVPPWGQRTVDSKVFEAVMLAAGYMITSSAPAHQGRIKIWWTHTTYSRVESIYSPDKSTVITAYHV